MADAPIHVEYNQTLDALTKILSRVDRPGDFYASGALVAPAPRLEIQGVGVVSFPLPASQAKEIARAAEQAPYGRGEETLVDTSVRKVWQVPLQKFQISGKGWPETLKTIVDSAALALGCEPSKVDAELYKLLLYEAGGFFISHRDTEKSEGMFGTLVVTLPSFHRGGELVIRHAGREVSLNLNSDEVSEISYAAFYADCQHEVKPVVEGCRLCLVYNLVLRASGKAAAKLIKAPDYTSEIEDASAVLSEWVKQRPAAPKIVYLLEHEYTPAGLKFSGLKNADAALAQALFQAAERAGCETHLGILHIEESGSAQPHYDQYSRRYGRRYHEGGGESSNFDIIEVCDSQQFIDNWIGRNDHPAEFGRIPLQDGELLPEGALDDAPPDERHMMEATGNEGASYERSYHRAVLVLWDKNRYPEVLLQSGVGAGVAYLKQLAKEAGSGSGLPSAKQKAACVFADVILRKWLANSDTDESFVPAPSESKERTEMLRLLVDLGHLEAVPLFVEKIVIPGYDGSENAALADAASLMEPKAARSVIVSLFQRKMKYGHVSCLELLKKLSKKKNNKSAGFKDALRGMAAAAVTGLDQIGGAETDQYSYWDWQERRQARPLTGAVVAGLFETLRQMELEDLAQNAAATIIGRPAAFLPDEVLVPALPLMAESGGRPSNTQLPTLWKHTAEYLLARSGAPPEKPKDWAQQIALSCKCAHCQELRRFAADPAAQIYRFKMRQDLRSHVESTILTHRLDMDCETVEGSRPQTLVCTKNHKSYLAKLQQYKSDLEAMASMEKLSPLLPKELLPLSDRLVGAIRRGNGN